MTSHRPTCIGTVYSLTHIGFLLRNGSNVQCHDSSIAAPPSNMNGRNDLAVSDSESDELATDKDSAAGRPFGGDKLGGSSMRQRRPAPETPVDTGPGAQSQFQQHMQHVSKAQPPGYMSQKGTMRWLDFFILRAPPL